jgi:hypothetical protein
LWAQWTSTFKEFLEQCLVKDPNKRADAATLSKHKFITDAGSPAKILGEMVEEVARIMADPELRAAATEGYDGNTTTGTMLAADTIVAQVCVCVCVCV